MANRSTSSVIAMCAFQKLHGILQNPFKMPVSAIYYRILTDAEKQSQIPFYPEGDVNKIWFGAFQDCNTMIGVSDSRHVLVRQIKKLNCCAIDLAQLG